MTQPRPEDDPEWEIAEGIPQLDEPFIQQFLQGRDALVAQEKKQRSDRVFRENLSPTATEACSIVDQIRFEEQQTIWTKELEDSLAESDGDVFPGMMYNLAKDRMQKSKIFQIVKRMPKGALLHCHLEPMVDLDWVLEELLTTEGIHFRANRGLRTEEDRSTATFSFKYVKSTQDSNDESAVWSDTYKPDTCLPAATAAETFPDGGRAGFVKWVKSRAVLTMEESIQHHYGVNDIWRRFYATFGVLRHMMAYEPIFRKFIYKMCQQLLEDGVFWVEVRYVFAGEYYLEGQETPEKTPERKLRAMIEEIERFKASDEGKEFWGARLIWSSLRGGTKKQIIADMKLCIELKKLFPNFIAGYDLVGQEDSGRPLQDLIPELFWFKKACMQAGIDLPFFFHAGECLGDGDLTDENLFDAVLLGTRRIGHGFSLYKHPLLVDMVKDKRILIESCPISNEVLRLTSSILSHPLPALLSRGVPVALCNDDPANLGHPSNGLTHDFTQALLGWENLGLAGLGSLAENSVRWSNYEDCTQKEWLHDVKMGAAGKSIKADRLKDWIGRWERFCEWVVEVFGADENSNPER